MRSSAETLAHSTLNERPIRRISLHCERMCVSSYQSNKYAIWFMYIGHEKNEHERKNYSRLLILVNCPESTEQSVKQSYALSTNNNRSVYIFLFVIVCIPLFSFCLKIKHNNDCWGHAFVCVCACFYGISCHWLRCVCVRVIFRFGNTAIALRSVCVFRIQIVSISIINNTRLKSVRLCYFGGHLRLSHASHHRWALSTSFSQPVERSIFIGTWIFHNFRRFVLFFLPLSNACLERARCLHRVTAIFGLKIIKKTATQYLAKLSNWCRFILCSLVKSNDNENRDVKVNNRPTIIICNWLGNESSVETHVF